MSVGARALCVYWQDAAFPLAPFSCLEIAGLLDKGSRGLGLRAEIVGFLVSKWLCGLGIATLDL